MIKDLLFVIAISAVIVIVVFGAGGWLKSDKPPVEDVESSSALDDNGYPVRAFYETHEIEAEYPEKDAEV